MSIKSDKWIRRMAQEHGMIEPFEPNQVKEIDGKRIVSYGTSSYGYDVRCADEFKLFTNVYSAVVDPKNFDSKSFVDIKGDYVIIPPNSFALARTVEYFRIPRSVMTICLGKSTYARCFRGDTRVALANGTAPTLEELARRADSGETFQGYSVSPAGRVIVTQLENPRFIGRDSLVEVVLDNEASIYCTPDHEFMMCDGRMLQANDLRPRHSLMSLNQQFVDGYEVAYSCTSSLKIQMPLTSTHSDLPYLSNPPRQFRPSESRNNYKVSKVREIVGDHDVYCLTVPEAGNFALKAGVFVHNCGIIVNVTPFEPEWEGYVTLEFSNTTPMPAKIYANEGVAQVIFFEADEVCEVSYKDRGGKYQGQHGVTPPKL
jgi:deoxycytidine triphosphate deaminase